MGERQRHRSIFREASASFLLPFFLLLSVLAAFGVFPFGGKTLLVADMSSEYIHYFTYLHRAVRDGGSLLRSWQMGMGLNMMGLIAFYCASPFTLLLLAIPESLLTEGILLLTLLKCGCCGLSFHLLLRKRFSLHAGWRLCLSTAYAMMGYVMYYSSNLMWLDGVALLPLCILGVERLVAQKKTGLLLITLVLVFWSSYYIGYMIGVFLFLFFTIRNIERTISLKQYLLDCLRLAGVAALAAGCCAVLLLPAFLNLWHGQDGMWAGTPPAELTYALSQLSYKLLPGVYDTLTDPGLPNVYCSLLGAMLALLFFLNRKISPREKLCFGGLLAVLAISMCSGFLDLAWHAFEDPTWFPARYSFLFPFLCLYLGARCLERREGLSMGHYFVSAAALAILLADAALLRDGEAAFSLVLPAVFLLIVYALFCGLSRFQTAAPWLALALLCGELWYNGWSVFRGIDAQLHYRDKEGYVTDRAAYQEALPLLPESEPYRVERAAPWTANHSLSLGYPSLSHYSTTTDQALNGFLQRLGYNTGTINELRFSPGSPVISGLLGVRYLLAEENPGALYHEVAGTGAVSLYENPQAYPLAFFAENAAGELEGRDPFTIANRWMSSLNGDTAFQSLTFDVDMENTAHRQYDGGIQAYAKLDPTKEAWVSWTIANPTEQEAFLWFDRTGCRYSRVTADVNDEALCRILAYRNNPVVPLGSGKEITFTAKIDGSMLVFRDLYCATLDSEAVQAGAERAREQQMDFTVFEDTKVEGAIAAPSNGYIVTTFPLDSGWTVKVDGEKVPAQRYADAFLAIPVKEGIHNVSMRYRPPGFAAGCGISAASLVAACFLYRRKKRGCCTAIKRIKVQQCQILWKSG